MVATEKFLSDYTPPAFDIESVSLEYVIPDRSDMPVTVRNTLVLSRKIAGTSDIFLSGVGLELQKMMIDQKILDGDMYRIDPEGITLFDVPDHFALFVETSIFPEKNTELEGLYFASGMYCTQNEPEGFRRMTYFLDRPDVMSIYTVRISSPKKYPLLLSNGNKIDSGEESVDRHFAVWHDPYKKPSYLFALVVGDLDSMHDEFVTMTGKKVDLWIYSEKGKIDKCRHAMNSLKKAMKWDEERFGREYDLDIFHIVAIDSFNMGAMENKSLNIFNTLYVFADMETATDQDFLGVESVIGHEYFHNWTGNRITCRDWFQLTLKEGLTVYRDHEFSGDMNSYDTMRIANIKTLREVQYPEDAGPTAHPIQPASYKEMNNFYTATVYEKGSEVIRMMSVLLGPQVFRKAMDLYFDIFDGQAVRTQDFVWAMSEASGMDLSQFEETWYHQERTPMLIAEGSVENEDSIYRLVIRQKIDTNTRGESQKPFYYPLGIALFDGNTGEKIPMKLRQTSTNFDKQNQLSRDMLIVSQKEEVFEFEVETDSVILSLNRSFTAPIRIVSGQGDPLFLMRYETDGFARYDACISAFITQIRSILSGGEISEAYLDAFEFLLQPMSDELYQSLLLQIPSVSSLMNELESPVDPLAILIAREKLCKSLVKRYSENIFSLYQNLYENRIVPENITSSEIARRALLAGLLNILSYSDDTESVLQMAVHQYKNTTSMTLKCSALSVLDRLLHGIDHSCFAVFREKYATDTLTIMKYFSFVGLSSSPDVIHLIKQTSTESFFQSLLPNHIRALYGAFTRNDRAFHNLNGSGYRFIADEIMRIDPFNSMTAARLASAYRIYPRLSEDYQKVMLPVILGLLKNTGLSVQSREILEKIIPVSGV